MARLTLTQGQTFGTITGGATVQTTDVIGTNGSETVILGATAKATFDGSFNGANGGQDTINILSNSANYLATLSGSALLLTGRAGSAAAGASILIPIGPGGSIINFADLTAGLTFDSTSGSALLGGQVLTSAATVVTGGTGNPPSSLNASTVVLPGLGDSTINVLRLTGDQDVRIDITNPTNQITGVDLNGDGAIALNGQENNPAFFNGTAVPTAVQGTNHVVVDAYIRDRLDLTNTSANFLGNIYFDGTGFDGDGVNTDGNIVLGGLGADTILGGIGNDFIVGGGSTAAVGGDSLFGGRNGDFFFVDLSLLRNISAGSSNSAGGPGNIPLSIDGGSTTDSKANGNNTPQDADWLLVEAQDDEEPLTISLLTEGSQTLRTDVTSISALSEIENVDLSGNLYGFVNNIDVSLGEGGTTVERAADDIQYAGTQNQGIGTTAQANITGSAANNVLIGGYDNDLIQGASGNDIIFGGNLEFNIHPNLPTIRNDGRDELFGGAGNDAIVFEADGGIIDGDGGVEAGAGHDTLYLTEWSMGSNGDRGNGNVASLTTDDRVRIDLLANGNIDQAAGYGGSDALSQDQTNYKAPGANRVTVTNMDSVIATGLGAVDYIANGANNPDLPFNNQQNQLAFDGNLDLRGDNAANTLYASGGADTIEGRMGNDRLSGGEGNDDFLFQLAVNTGDGLDIIHRQRDDNGDNIWDNANPAGPQDPSAYVRDFGLDDQASLANSTLTLRLDDLQGPDLTNFPVNGVIFTLGGEQVRLTVDTPFTQGSYADFVAGLNAALADEGLTGVTATLANGIDIVLTDAAGRDFVTGSYTFVNDTVPGNGNLLFTQKAGPPTETQDLDRLVYVSYEDRADAERTNDDAAFGSKISLGRDNYAQDLVVDFTNGTTTIAEDQAYRIEFSNLTTQDVVRITVNGVLFQLTVGRDLDNNIIAGEDTASTADLGAIQSAFIDRLVAFINEYGDNDTAAGELAVTRVPATAGLETAILISQASYSDASDQTVFLRAPVVDVQSGNSSGGEVAQSLVVNVSQSEVVLYKFDGSDGRLNDANVLFVGDKAGTDNDATFSRSVLETATDEGGVLLGSHAVIVDNGVNTFNSELANTVEAQFLSSADYSTETKDRLAVSDADNDGKLTIFDNVTTNSTLVGAAGFAVHGDDLLIGGSGNDTIIAGSGDDRVVGSLGTDKADGGKDFYVVKNPGSGNDDIVYLNAYEASLQKLTQADLLAQTETGLALAPAADTTTFTDVLQFSQADFSPTAQFTVDLNNQPGDAFVYKLEGGQVVLHNGGAGTVFYDTNTDGTFEGSTRFTNFEYVRTISGSGRAIAGAGQGNDTLLASALSNDTGGVLYDLTQGSKQGQLRYSTDSLSKNLDGSLNPQIADYEAVIMRIDGIENFTSGNGNDFLLIDEGEIEKNNVFNAGLGNLDTIVYQNNYGTATDPFQAEASMRIVLNTAADTDEVRFFGGRIQAGSTPVDTLISVERIWLQGNSARNNSENDVLDVSNVAGGAVVDYTTGEVRDNNGNVQTKIQGIQEIENIQGGAGRDVVLVADTMTNSQDDGTKGTPPESLVIATYFDYDVTNAKTGQRIGYDNLPDGSKTQAINQLEYTYSLDGGLDRVDYSAESGRIVSVVNFDDEDRQYILVDGNSDGDLIDGGTDRVDVADNVEELVASKGESIIDLTALGEDVALYYDNVLVPPFDTSGTNAPNTVEGYIRFENLDNSTPFQGGFKYVELYDNPNVGGTAGETALWNRVEGSDEDEYIELTSAQLDYNHTFNLRGGDNEVNYNEQQSRGISLSVDAILPAVPGGESSKTVITVGGKENDGSPSKSGAIHSITSYNQLGPITGTLRVEASQSEFDDIVFNNPNNMLLVVGMREGNDDVVTVSLQNKGAFNSANPDIVLAGFETLTDGKGDDIYDFTKDPNALNNAENTLDFVDNATEDHDVIRVNNQAATDAFNGGKGSSTIDLGALNAKFGIEWDVLDITAVTSTKVTTVNGTSAGADGGTTDELVFGALGQVNDVNEFESIVFTEATGGTDFTFDTDTDQLTGAGGAFIQADGFLNTLSAGGTVFEGTTNGPFVAPRTSAVTLTVTGSDNFNLYGGTGADTLTGNSGTNVLYGGLGADTMDGGFTPTVNETYTVEFTGVLANGESVTVLGQTFTNTTGGDVGADTVGAFFASKLPTAYDPDTTSDDNGADFPSPIAVTYNAVSDTLSFTFAQDVTPEVTAADVIENGVDFTAGLNAGAEFAPATSETDTYLYLRASKSTNATTDALLNFDASATVDDVIDLSNIDADPNTAGNQAFAGITYDTAQRADKAGVVNAGSQANAFGGADIFIGGNDVNAYVLVDVDQSNNYTDGDMVICLNDFGGFANIGNIDASNFAF